MVGSASKRSAAAVGCAERILVVQQQVQDGHRLVDLISQETHGAQEVARLTARAAGAACGRGAGGTNLPLALAARRRRPGGRLSLAREAAAGAAGRRGQGGKAWHCCFGRDHEVHGRPTLAAGDEHTARIVTSMANSNCSGQRPL